MFTISVLCFVVELSSFCVLSFASSMVFLVPGFVSVFCSELLVSAFFASVERSLFRVSFPARPSILSPFADWNALTALIVFLP